MNCVCFFFFCFLDGEYFTYTRHEPIGVCGQIIPVSEINTKGWQTFNCYVTKFLCFFSVYIQPAVSKVMVLNVVKKILTCFLAEPEIIC